MTLVIAHRGASATHRENTCAAFRAAVTAGADGIELDVRRTVDDRLVVHHDARLDDGRLLVETRAADLPDAVPTLEAALDECAGVFVNIEIKNDPAEPDHDPTEWVAHRVVGLLARIGGGPRWLLSSFRRETIDRCRLLSAPDGTRIRTAWLVSSIDSDAVQAAVSGGHDALHPWVGGLERVHVTAAHSAGIAVNTWTCNDPARVCELVGWGVDAVCTDDPRMAVECRRRSVPVIDRADPERRV